MELLKTLYEVLGSSYPRLSIGVAAIVGALFFGGSWWLIGKRYEADQQMTAPAISQVVTRTDGENRKDHKPDAGEAPTEVPKVAAEVQDNLDLKRAGTFDEPQPVSEIPEERSATAIDSGYPPGNGLEDPIQAKLTAMNADVQKLRYGADRDAALKKIIALGIIERRPELVTAYVSKLRYGEDRDKAYMTLIDLLLEMGKFDQASRLIQLLRYGADRDDYTERVLESRERWQ